MVVHGNRDVLTNGGGQATTKMVQEAFSYLDLTPNMEAKLELIDTLRTVTEGKVSLSTS